MYFYNSCQAKALLTVTCGKNYSYYPVTTEYATLRDIKQIILPRIFYLDMLNGLVMIKEKDLNDFDKGQINMM